MKGEINHKINYKTIWLLNFQVIAGINVKSGTFQSSQPVVLLIVKLRRNFRWLEKSQSWAYYDSLWKTCPTVAITLKLNKLRITFLLYIPKDYSARFFHGHLQDCSESKCQGYLLMDEITELYCVIHGIQVETVSTVKASGIFEFQLNHRETISVCPIGNKMRMEQSCSEVSAGVVTGVYWSGFYSDGWSVDRTALCLGKMLVAYDKNNTVFRRISSSSQVFCKMRSF